MSQNVDDRANLIDRDASKRKECLKLTPVVLIAGLIVSTYHIVRAVPYSSTTVPTALRMCPTAAARSPGEAHVTVYLGNGAPPLARLRPCSTSSHVAHPVLPRDAGCFWERQWAYVELETDCKAPFRRRAADVTSRVGYAGGAAPLPPSAACYHTGDGRDYALLGHAEVVAIELANSSAALQMSALARDFFASFQGAEGKRIRPDPMDRGSPYRSVVGLPGGVSSSLYPVLARENKWGMELKPGVGGDADATNVVWVVDTARFPFYTGEVYHQFHCNFFQR